MATALKQSYERWVEWESEKDLRRWGRFHKREVFYSHVKCNLGKLIDLGVNIPSGYATISHYYPDILQTQRIWAFMPGRWMQVVYMHYVYDTSQAQNALSLGITRNQFRRYLHSGFRWYCQHRDTDFSELNLL